MIPTFDNVFVLVLKISRNTVATFLLCVFHRKPIGTRWENMPNTHDAEFSVLANSLINICGGAGSER